MQLSDFLHVCRMSSKANPILFLSVFFRLQRHKLSQIWLLGMVASESHSVQMNKFELYKKIIIQPNLNQHFADLWNDS